MTRTGRRCAGLMETLVAELTHLARRSPEISQRSGVSVRVSVSNSEVLEAAALKRAIRLGEPLAAPRVSDLGAVMASTVGKVELETVGDEAPEERIVERLITKALFATFGRRVEIDDLDEVVTAFEEGLVIETGDRVPSREYVRWMAEVPGLHDVVRRLGTFDVTDGSEEPAASRPRSSSCSRVHLARRINKDRGVTGTVSTGDDRLDAGPAPPARSRGGDRRARAAARPRGAYSRWTAASRADLEADEILDELADDVMAEGDVESALRQAHRARVAFQ